MNLPIYTRRMEGGSAHRLARRTIEAVASVWHAPRQRRLLLALIAAVLSAFAFAHIAEDYLTNDPSHART